MFKVIYNRYKVLFWVVLSLLLLSGTISNYVNGSMLDVVVNGVLFLVSITFLIISIRNFKK